MARPDKAAAVAELTEAFRNSNTAVLTEYRGLTVAQLKQLRRSLGDQTTYAVVKNTLTKIAAREAGVEGLDAMLQGPSAIAFVQGDPVEAAKGLRDFAKAHPLLIIKGGVMDGRPVTAAELSKIADLESREVLLAKLAGAMKGSLSQAVSLFAAPLAQTARLVEALRAKAEADPSILAGGAGTPAPAAEEPAAEAPEAAEPVAEVDAADSAEAPVAEATSTTEDVEPAAAEAPSAVETDTTEADAAAEPVAEGTDSTDSTDSAESTESTEG